LAGVGQRTRYRLDRKRGVGPLWALPAESPCHDPSAAGESRRYIPARRPVSPPKLSFLLRQQRLDLGAAWRAGAPEPRALGPAGAAAPAARSRN
jgi:hypothetical protein